MSFKKAARDILHANICNRRESGLMPQYDWHIYIPLKGQRRRKRDKYIKRLLRGRDFGEGFQPVQLADYRAIAAASDNYIRIGNHITKLYSLTDLASIYGVSRSTTSRWFAKGLLPKPYCYAGRNRPRYLKEQVFVICTVLNQIYEQGYRQFRLSHELHLYMLDLGNAMVHRRMPYKATREKHTLRHYSPRNKRPSEQETKELMRYLRHMA